MMSIVEFVNYLKTLFPDVKFFIGAINKNNNTCIGVYRKGDASPNIAIGGTVNTSYDTLPVMLLIHWTENTQTCEQMANSIYEKLLGLSDFMIGSRRIASIDVLSVPIDVGRDDKNICEMTIQLNITYSKEA